MSDIQYYYERLVNKRYLSIADQQVDRDSWYSTLIRLTKHEGETMLVEEQHYFNRIKASTLKHLVHQAKHCNLRAFDAVSCLYGTGIGLQHDLNAAKAWRNYSILPTKEIAFEVDRAYRVLVKDAKQALSKSRGGYLYTDTYLAKADIYYNYLEKKQHSIDKLYKLLNKASKTTSIKDSKYHTDLIYYRVLPKGIKTTCIYQVVDKELMLVEALALIDGYAVSILSDIPYIKSIPYKHAKILPDYLNSINQLTNKVPNTVVVTGILCIANANKQTMLKYKVHSTKKALNKIHDKNIAKHLDFIAYDIGYTEHKDDLFSKTKLERLPLDPKITNTHLSSCGFLTLSLGKLTCISRNYKEIDADAKANTNPITFFNTSKLNYNAGSLAVDLPAKKISFVVEY